MDTASTAHEFINVAPAAGVGRPRVGLVLALLIGLSAAAAIFALAARQ
jgi:hypothetical protein